MDPESRIYCDLQKHLYNKLPSGFPPTKSGLEIRSYDEFLCFIAGNPLDLRDFGAEIELCLGEEQEKHIINSSTAVYIPKELPHCPLEFKVIKKPIVFLVVMLGDYIKKPVPKR